MPKVQRFDDPASYFVSIGMTRDAVDDEAGDEVVGIGVSVIRAGREFGGPGYGFTYQCGPVVVTETSADQILTLRQVTREVVEAAGVLQEHPHRDVHGSRDEF
ncbi:hypothetical protein DF17_27660 [Streptomyces rimosus]|uniref:hypothetical protein n=1 Tax=Streptomyces sp. SID5471 TaxID=2690298 RepID=UPI0002ACBAE5|nr:MULTISPECIES: hypothetical protein [Streptomyces]KEF03627.1 hypothetical protein DF17_27660 [Streptomyces rimosus]KEF15282.1 hypothetical protein DF18_34675 [Streptomyces rimosus]KUJ32382.1 hypothetical protein ADK46_22825 [Streptomyces rimosus subsp. rimosus]